MSAPAGFPRGRGEEDDTTATVPAGIAWWERLAEEVAAQLWQHVLATGLLTAAVSLCLGVWGHWLQSR